MAPDVPQGELFPRLTDAEKALMHSQHGPLNRQNDTFVCFCFCLHAPADVAVHFDFGHHCAACAEAGVWGKRGFPLECAAAQACEGDH